VHIIPTTATHQDGGKIDAVIVREDMTHLSGVYIVDVGLSDHHLLTWSISTPRSQQQQQQQEVVYRRPWLRHRCVKPTIGQLTSTTWQPCTTVCWRPF